MAEETKGSGEEQKIKDLEASLAKELDQQVDLSQTSDPRLNGEVQLNPNINPEGTSSAAAQLTTYEPVAKPNRPEENPAPPMKAEAEVAELSLDDLDSLLSQEMPELSKEIESLREAGEDLKNQNLNLSATDVSDSADTDPEADLPIGKKIKMRVKSWLTDKFNRLIEFLYSTPIKFYKYTLVFFKETLPKYISAFVKILTSKITQFKNWFASLQLPQKLMLLGMIVIGLVLIKLVSSKIHLESLTQSRFVDNYFSRGAETFKLQNPDLVPLSEEGMYPEHVVLLEKVVVNIKASESSTSNPMVAMRLYFEVNTKDAAVELKDREKEVRDLVQRVLETYSYDQIISMQGKKAFKEGLRREISTIMNTGVVKAIYIDDILIKP